MTQFDPIMLEAADALICVNDPSGCAHLPRRPVTVGREAG
jgi:hypothetical protein